MDTFWDLARRMEMTGRNPLLYKHLVEPGGMAPPLDGSGNAALPKTADDRRKQFQAIEQPSCCGLDELANQNKALLGLHKKKSGQNVGDKPGKDKKNKPKADSLGNKTGDSGSKKPV